MQSNPIQSNLQDPQRLCTSHPKTYQASTIAGDAEEEHIDSYPALALLSIPCSAQESPPAFNVREGRLRIILISTVAAHVVLIIHMLDILPRMALRLLLIHPIEALGLEQLVDLRARDADQELLGELVRDGLACAREHQLVACTRWGKVRDTNLPCADGPRRA